MEAQGIGFWLTKRAFLDGAGEAVVDGRRRVTYRELNDRVNRLAGVLQSLGLKPGDRCALLAYNCLEYVEVIFATAKMGLLLVPLNWRLSPAELAFNLSDSGSETLIFDPGFAEVVLNLVGQTSVRRLLVLGAEEQIGAPAYDQVLTGSSGTEPEPAAPVGLDTPHIIMYTAGTTGRPKGAVLTQGASFWNALNLEMDLHFTARDRDLLVLPMFHIGGIGLFTLPLLQAGGTVVIQRTFEPAETLRLLQEEQITLFFGVPAVFLFLIQHPDFRAQAFEQTRLVMSGGAPLPISLVKQYQQAGIVLQQGFGMSEAAPSIATLRREKALEKAGSIGRALFYLEARVVDEDLKEVATDAVGELVIRGPNLMQGYWNRPEATAEALAGGWFHTGDLARMDEEGDLTIVERKKDMFISGGENVYPAEVENVLFELAPVSEAAVVGLPDEKWGEVGRAVVVLKEGQTVSEAEILDHLRGRLARYKIPKSVVFVDRLPRNAAGKVLKTELRERLKP
ncbi:MAG: long-chain fatty acid--CoA ligase [Deltaproteobacteria bacterium]|nr:long-chain fatty acid--CoA ligase [Deltaproteobacteria bacterium]